MGPCSIMTDFTKTCSRCKQEFPATLEFFHKNRGGKYGLRSNCKSCCKEYRRENKEAICELGKKYRQENKEALREKKKKYRQENKEAILERQKKYVKNRYHADIQFRIKKTQSRRMRKLFSKNGSSTVDFIGCSIDELKLHLEKQFADGMNWENYGYHGWHVDHIRPCCSFDLTDPEQQKECFHYTNLQPLWAKDNMSKGGRYGPEGSDC